MVLDRVDDLGDHGLEGLGGCAVGLGDDDGHSLVAGVHDACLEGDASEELDSELVGGVLSSAGLEDVGDLSAVGADESAHVLHDTDDWDVGDAGEGDCLPGVEEGDLLGGGDDDGTVGLGDELDDGECFISGSRGHIDDEIIQRAPVDVLDELLHGAGPDGTPPGEGGVLAGQEEGHGDQLEGRGYVHGDEETVVVYAQLPLLLKIHYRRCADIDTIALPVCPTRCCPKHIRQRHSAIRRDFRHRCA